MWRRVAGTRGEVGRLGADAASRRREVRRAGWAGWLGEVWRGTGAHQGAAGWLGEARLFYEPIMRGFTWSKTPPIYGILLLGGRHFP